VPSSDRIAYLLRPFLEAPSPGLLAAIGRYLELLLHWNARLNLTAVRDPEQVVTRHMGESLFAARQLLPTTPLGLRAIDVGSGAGFPGLPLKLYAVGLQLTLIESQQKKATFLKEAIRMLQLADSHVFGGRAESFADRGELVTLRAVERFDQVLPVAASLLAGAGARLGLLIGAAQAESARRLLPSLRWQQPVPIPLSQQRILLVGEK
jgi:16S rRNA (guanine527-N7)-methyltransferase